jgi:hypothetical protein
MDTESFADSTPAQLDAAWQRLLSRGAPRGALVLLAEGDGWPNDALDRWLARQTLPLAGGIFPRVLAGRRVLAQGGVLVALDVPIEVYLVGMTDSPSIPDALIGVPPKTLLVFLDGLSPHVQPLVEAMYLELGSEPVYAGGGCGSLSLKQQPCVITPQGVRQDVAALVAMDAPAGVGVRHGWQPLDDDLLLEATASKGNVIHSLNWRPAFEIYREVLAHHGVTVTAEDFFTVAKAYPLALVRPRGELIVRDPIRVEGQSLVCVGAVPPQATLTVLRGDAASLLAAAQHLHVAAQGDLVRRAATAPQGRLVFDCISRVLFLGERFTEEAARLVPDDLPTAGALTLGEVAEASQGALSFYNKTAVAAVLG